MYLDTENDIRIQGYVPLSSYGFCVDSIKSAGMLCACACVSDHDNEVLDGTKESWL